eukprot:GHUV01046615.1.p1 GENE.GHUV01046615.1~~GHUV01046615.1.p1  ORF type:complete len:100 (+),score=12.55 GHUV01046615.1:40-300(+)
MVANISMATHSTTTTFDTAYTPTCITGTASVPDESSSNRPSVSSIATFMHTACIRFCCLRACSTLLPASTLELPCPYKHAGITQCR